jgi:ankyrin repeat protein
LLTTILSCLVQDATLVKWCLSLGGDPNALSPSKRSVLHSAACVGSIESLEALIAAGGVIKSPSPSDDVVAYAVDGHDQSYDRIAVIEYLLDHGADINAYYAQNQDQLDGINIIMGRRTALHLAVGKGNEDLVKMLIQRGADPSKRMWNYSTAYTSIQKHMGDPNWREHVEWLDTIAYARFSGFEGIARFLEESQHLEPSFTRC